MKNLNYFCALIGAGTAIFFSGFARGQVTDAPDNVVAGIPANYTESKVGAYTLPDPLKMFDGKPVSDANQWINSRRPELLKYYESEIYGRVPDTAPKVTWEVISTDTNALGGKAVMKKLAGHMGSPSGPAIGVTLYTPAEAGKPAPILVAISFNFPIRRRVVTTGTAAASSTNAAVMQGTPAVPATTAPIVMRGTPAELIANGFAYATIVYNSIETDTQGQPNINLARKLGLAPGQAAPAPDEWGAIASWAWGISRVIDYLETDPAVDSKRIAITGVSRLGKTVLWAAASDPRVALVIASCSGEGGASLARRNYGETIAHLVAPSRYPYQFAGNYAKYAKDPGTLKVDTHCLISLIAPRAVLLQTGDQDRWSDPRGEFLAAVAATPVFKLLGKRGMDGDVMPGAGQLVGHDLAYYMHSGGHGTVPSDWDVYLKFMKIHLEQPR